MYDKVILLLLLFMNIYETARPTDKPYEFNPKNILRYEYGKRVPGDHLAYHKTGSIPGLTPYWSVYVNMSTLSPVFEKKFTYLIVEYVSPMSAVDINYDPVKTTINFYIRIPFQGIEYGYAGFAMKIHNHRRDNCD